MSKHFHLCTWPQETKLPHPTFTNKAEVVYLDFIWYILFLLERLLDGVETLLDIDSLVNLSSTTWRCFSVFPTCSTKVMRSLLLLCIYTWLLLECLFSLIWLFLLFLVFEDSAVLCFVFLTFDCWEAGSGSLSSDKESFRFDLWRITEDPLPTETSSLYLPSKLK